MWEQLPHMRDALHSSPPAHHSAVHAAWLLPLLGFLPQLQPLAEMLEGAVDFERAARHEYVLRAEFDGELAALRAECDALEQQLEPEFHHVSRMIIVSSVTSALYSVTSTLYSVTSAQ